MAYLQFSSILFIIIVFLLSVFEYVMLRNKVEVYYRNGPFLKTEIIKSPLTFNELIDKLSRKKSTSRLSIKVVKDGILLNHKPSFLLFFLKGEFPTQRIFISSPDDPKSIEFRFEIRPFYSAFLLPSIIIISLIFNVIMPNEYANTSMKVFGIIVVCLLALAIFLPFRPRSDYIIRLKDFIKNL